MGKIGGRNRSTSLASNKPSRKDRPLQPLTEKSLHLLLYPLKWAVLLKCSKCPPALTEEAIWDIIKRFGTTARIMKEAGVYRLSNSWRPWVFWSVSFLSPNSNIRTDQWGGSLANRAPLCYRNLPRNSPFKLAPLIPLALRLILQIFNGEVLPKKLRWKSFDFLEMKALISLKFLEGTYEKTCHDNWRSKEKHP